MGIEKSLQKAIKDDANLKECLKKVSEGEMLFNASINRYPTLAEYTLNLIPLKNNDGTYARTKGGELYGTQEFGYDPGLKQASKAYFDTVRSTCR